MRFGVGWTHRIRFELPQFRRSKDRLLSYSCAPALKFDPGWAWLITISIALVSGCMMMEPSRDVVHLDGQSLLGEGHTVFQQAMHAYRKGNTDRAVAKFEQAIRLNPSDGASHNNLGLLFYEQRKLPLAASHFDLASQIRPGDATPINNLGMTFEAGGRVMEAIELYEQAAEIEPDNPLYLGNLLRARLRIGEEGEFISDQLRHLAFIENRQDWASWVDEQLAIHLNPNLDRGPSVDQSGALRGARSTQNDRSQSSPSANSDAGRILQLEPSTQDRSNQRPSSPTEPSTNELLPVPAPLPF